MARWSFRFFGPFVAEQDGAPLRGFRSDKVRALLAFLAVQPERPWPRTTLADLLWPDYPERTARANLRNALSNLRHVLGDASSSSAFLELGDATVTAAASADCWNDVLAFQDLVPAADTTGDAAAEPATVERLALALALVRGEFLQGFALDSPPFESWLTDTREQLRHQATRAARSLARAQVLLGDDEGAAATTARWLDLDPWDEAGHRHLMHLLARQGRRAAALMQYEACRHRLAADVGAEPEAATTELAEAIRTAPVGSDDVDAAARAWPGLSTPPPDAVTVVAREPELAELTAALEHAAEGHGGAFFVTGEPGSGKTALLAEFARRALDADPRLLVAWGSCSAITGRGDPFEPFRHAMQMLTGEAEAPPAARTWGAIGARRLWQRFPATLTALLDHGPDLVDRFVSGRALLAFARRHGGVGAEPRQRLEQSYLRPEPPAGHRFQAALLAQCTAVWSELARHRPLLLLLDDLQWIDPASIDLLFQLAREVSERRAMIVGAYRAEEATPPRSSEGRALLDVVDELLVRQGGGRIDLSAGAGRGFVDALLDLETNALPDDFRARLHARTSGNPLFTIELLRGMQLRGELRRDALGRWFAQPTLDWDALPARVEAVIAHRIDHLSPACARLLTIGSVEGEAFTAGVAAKVAGMPLAEACDLLSHEAGRRHHLVSASATHDADGRPIERYRFRHGLFQTYLHQRLDAVERARLHAEVARALLDAYPSDAEHRPHAALALAHHFEAAGLWHEAIDRYAEAASHALRLSAHAEAAAHLRTALRLLDGLPATPERDHRELALQLALGPPLTAAKGWAPPELETAYARAQQLVAGLQDDVHLVEALWPLTLFRLGRSEHAEVDRLMARMARLAKGSGDPGLLALTPLNVSPFYQGRFEEARRVLEAACAHPDLAVQRDLAQRFGMAPAVVGLAYLAECLWVLGLPSAADDRGREALDLAARIDHPMTTCYALGRACWRAATRGDAEATRHAAGELGRTAEAHGLGAFRLAATFFHHQAGLATATDANAAEHDLQLMRGAIDTYRAAGTALNGPAFLTLYAQACGSVGQVERGLTAANQALAEGARSGEAWFGAEAWRIQGELLTALPDARPGTARTCFERACRVARRQCAVAYEHRALERLARDTAPP